MIQIREKLVSDMQAAELLRVASIERVQSQDDYSLLTSPGFSGRELFY